MTERIHICFFVLCVCTRTTPRVCRKEMTEKERQRCIIAFFVSFSLSISQSIHSLSVDSLSLYMKVCVIFILHSSFILFGRYISTGFIFGGFLCSQRILPRLFRHLQFLQSNAPSICSVGKISLSKLKIATFAINTHAQNANFNVKVLET